MKKLIALLLISSMVLAGGLMVFADEVVERECVLSEDQMNLMLEVKTAFLNEKVSEGVISQDEADVLLKAVASRENNNALKDLGFGQWVRSSEYAENLESFLPHKNLGSKEKGLGRGQGKGLGRGNRNGEMLRVQP